MSSKALLRITRRSAVDFLRRSSALASSTPRSGEHHEGTGNRSRDHHEGTGNQTRRGVAAGAALSLGAAGLYLQNELKADEPCDATQEVLKNENRIRQFSKPETIFDYFASYMVPDFHGKNVILMSVSDFYNAVTPGSTLTHGTGRGVYTILTEDEIQSKGMYENEKIPCISDDKSILNKIQKEGLLTYIDFTFLTHILATPKRYMAIAFHAFDVSADGDVECREFIHVMAKIVNYKGNPQDLMNQTHSGLLTYLFGEDRKKSIKIEDFYQLQKVLMDELLFIEYGRYDRENKNAITATDFCKHILYNAPINQKKKEKMIRRVEKLYGKNEAKISFEMYRNFYYLLFGGSDLERAMFFLDTDSHADGVDKKEFAGIAKWVSGTDLDPYILDVIFTLLDEDGDKNLSVKEFVPVMFQWRNSRGFQKTSVQISLGSLKI